MKLNQLQKHWDEFGKRDPLWAILTLPEKANGGWDPAEFFANGEDEIQRAVSYARDQKAELNPQRALDFGCGVGRLTQALCQHFAECHGVDIAPSMIAGANQYNQHPERCHYHLNDKDNLRLFPDNYFDFIYSVIVLQHIRPEYSLRYIREFVRVLAPNGIALFQIPSHLANPPLASNSSLGKQSAALFKRLLQPLRQKLGKHKPITTPTMEMYGVRQEIVIEAVQQAGGKVLAAQDDTWAGESWVSYRYCVSR